jgi:hypothetical protein
MRNAPSARHVTQTRTAKKSRQHIHAHALPSLSTQHAATAARTPFTPPPVLHSMPCDAHTRRWWPLHVDRPAARGTAIILCDRWAQHISHLQVRSKFCWVIPLPGDARRTLATESVRPFSPKWSCLRMSSSTHPTYPWPVRCRSQSMRRAQRRQTRADAPSR